MKTLPSPSFPLPALLAVLGLALAKAPAQNSTEWTFHKTADGAHPSPGEQRMLWLLNRARSNPPAEGAFLAATGDDSTEFAISYFGVDVARMRREFDATPAKPPAAFDRRLYEASRLHSEAMIQAGVQTHDGQIERVDSTGFQYSAIRLNIFAYTENPLYGHASLNIDIGGPASEGGMQTGRGHRLAIMSDPALPDLTNVGLALVAEGNPSTDVGPLVFSGAYAHAVEISGDLFNRFVVGTVWNDRNGNRMYDEGEGLDGVRVQLSPGPWHAVTGIAGGYAIPVTSAGTHTLTFSGGAFPGTHTRNLTLGNVSVQADAEISTMPVSQPTFSASLSVNPAGGLTLQWSGGTPPYQVQRSADPSRGWQNYGDPITASSMTVPMQGGAGFYRVIDSP